MGVITGLLSDDLAGRRDKDERDSAGRSAFHHGAGTDDIERHCATRGPEPTTPLAGRFKPPRPLTRLVFSLALMVTAAASAIISTPARAQEAQIQRGRYLVTLGGCNDCHTPGYFFGKPDMARFLGGSEVGFQIPGLGVFHGPNLTPDPETGLGRWSAEEIARAITKGERPDGRVLAPIMPWHAFAALTKEDVRAMVAFLKSLPPVRNQVPGPFGPSETPTSYVMTIVPPAGAAQWPR